MEETTQSSSYYGLKFPHFMIFFIFIYILAHKMFHNWGPKIRYEACSCFLSLFHGTPSVLLALCALFSIKSGENPQKMDFFGGNLSIFGAQNTLLTKLVLEFSTSYFIMDLLHYVVFKPDDVIFIAHHLATLYALLTCRFLVNHGGFSILVILVIAEVTSLCQNLWSLARLRKNDSKFAAKLYDLLVPEFYVFYTVARGVFAPLFVVKMGFVYASGVVDGVVPTWVWGSWMLLTISGIFGSMLWILNHWVVFYKEKMCKLQKLQ